MSSTLLLLRGRRNIGSVYCNGIYLCIIISDYSAANLRRQFALFRTSQFDYSVKFLALNNYVETYFCNVR